MNTYAKSFAGLLSATVLVLAMAATPSQAQNARYLSHNASSCEIFRGLSRSVPIECATEAEKARVQTLRSFGPTRGLVVFGENRPATNASVTKVKASSSKVAVVETQSARESGDLSIAFRAEFEFDSFALTPEAKQVIDRVAQVLKHDVMRDKVIEIQGHADATGTAAYNMSLSEKRAQAVEQYLVSQHQIDASRLRFVGKGETEPFDAAHPEASINRRVEFRNITG